MIKNKRILITGGAGSIGSELVRQLAPDNDVCIIDTNETAFFNLYEELKQKGFKISGQIQDVRNTDWLRDIKVPDIIFHCAALKHVTPSSWNPKEYVTTNILGTYNISDYAYLHKIKMINISTDKVVNPNSVMASTKKTAELIVRDAKHISVRFGNVLGSRGSVLEIWQRQIEKEEPLTVTDGNMTRYMMTIEQACELIIKADEIGKPGSIMVMDMGEKVNVLQLAKDILKKSGKEEKIEMIGIRQGESLTETLMTEDEKSRAVKIDNFWMIP